MLRKTLCQSLNKDNIFTSALICIKWFTFCFVCMCIVISYVEAVCDGWVVVVFNFMTSNFNFYIVVEGVVFIIYVKKGEMIQ